MKPGQVGGVWLTGNRVGETALKCEMPGKIAVRITRKRVRNSQPVGSAHFVIRNPHTGVPDLIPYNPDKQHLDNYLAAAFHRFCRRMDEPDPATADEFERFCKSFIVNKVDQLVDSDLLTVDQWLEGTKYKPARREYLGKLAAKTTTIYSWEFFCACFLKDEHYMEDKNPRAINSPSDVTKAVLGPLVKSIEKKFFKQFSHIFVKGSDPRTWPERLRNMFGDRSVMETDFKSFESHHRGVYSRVVHFFFMHMLRGTSMANSERRMISQLVLGTNVCQFQDVEVIVEERLMSGVLWTSLANGLLNFLILAFLNTTTMRPDLSPEQRVETIPEHFVGLVEGDDGICLNNSIPESLIKKMGLMLEFDVHSKFSEASFCGCVCDPDSLAIALDPLKILRSFFYLPGKYVRSSRKVKLALLRAKALSYTVTAPKCPVVRPLVDRILEITRGMSVDGVIAEFEAHKQDMIRVAQEELRQSRDYRRGKIPDSMRFVVWQRFGVSPEEQLIMEDAIERWDGSTDLMMDLSIYASDRDFKQVLDHFNDANYLAPPLPDELPHVPDHVREARSGVTSSAPFRRDPRKLRPMPLISPSVGHHLTTVFC